MPGSTVTSETRRSSLMLIVRTRIPAESRNVHAERSMTSALVAGSDAIVLSTSCAVDMSRSPVTRTTACSGDTDSTATANSVCPATPASVENSVFLR